MWRLLPMVLIIAGLGGCAGPPEPAPLPDALTLRQGCTDVEGSPIDAPSPTARLHLTDLGVIEVRLHQQLVPGTVQNFIELARAEFYDDTRFHSVIAGLGMQGGDPLSRDDDPWNDGQGGPGYTIPDEFHHRLRHDRAGMVTMATSGANAGGSQFFITFGPTPWLDDEHSVFGEVVDGHDVLEAVEAHAAPVDENGRPVDRGRPTRPIHLERVEIIPAGPGDATPGAVGIIVPDAIANLPPSGGDAGYLTIVTNCSAWSQRLDLDVDGASTAMTLPAAQRKTVPITVHIPPGEPGSTATLNLTISGGRTPVTVTLQAHRDLRPWPVVQDGDTVQVHYIGLLADGRLFDSTRDLDLPTFGNVTPRGPFTFTIGEGMPGFDQLANGTREGHTAVAHLTPAEGAGESRRVHGPLAGRDLFYSIEVLDVQAFLSRP